MSPQQLRELREQEYEQRLEAHRLRGMLYAQSDPEVVEEQLNQLLELEGQLSKVGAERATKQKADPKASGLILDNTVVKKGYLGVETTGLEARVHLRMAQLPTSICHLLDGDQDPLLSCWVRNARRIDEHSSGTRRLRMTSEIDGWSAKAVDTVEIKLEREHTFSQLPTLFRRRVQRLNELTRATLNIKLEDLDKGRIELHKTYPIWLLARTAVPFAIEDPKTGEWRDLTRYYGAFVTPHAPAVEEFLGKATHYHPQREFRGYQEGASVDLQVKALFDALKQEAEITYVSSVLAFSPEEGTQNQRVRLPRASLKLGVGNCIDVTVLFASLLENVGLHPAIVVTRGHTFLAWETKDAHKPWGYLETTKIGSHDFEQACKFGEIQAKGYKALRDQQGDESLFRQWPLRELRAVHRILPME